MSAPAGAGGLTAEAARQAARPVEFQGEFLAHMKVEFKRELDRVLLEHRRQTGEDVCTYVPIIPGGPGPDLPYQERIANLTYEDLPAVSAGFQYKEWLCPAFREKFYGRGLFEELRREGPGTEGGLNPDFAPFGVDDRCPEVHIFAACPFVMVVDERNLGDLPEPRSWLDLLDSRYEGAVCFNGTKYGPDLNILLYLARLYGDDALDRMRRNTASTTHASRMVRYMGTSRNGRAPIYVMNSFFAHVCASSRPRCHLVWPEDGAACQALFMVGKTGSYKRYRFLYDFVLGEEWGRRLAENRFASANPRVENGLEGPLGWFGWDFIYREDIDRIVARIDDLFGDVPNFKKQ